MTDQWQRFNESGGRGLDALGARQVHVYTWSKTYDNTTGTYSWSKSEHANSPTQMEWVEASPDRTTDASGTESSVDVEAYAPDESWVRGLTTVAEDGEHPVVLEDSLGGKQVEVHELTVENNGRVKLVGVEL